MPTNKVVSYTPLGGDYLARSTNENRIANSEADSEEVIVCRKILQIADKLLAERKTLGAVTIASRIIRESPFVAGKTTGARWILDNWPDILPIHGMLIKELMRLILNNNCTISVKREASMIFKNEPSLSFNDTMILLRNGGGYTRAVIAGDIIEEAKKGLEPETCIRKILALVRCAHTERIQRKAIETGRTLPGWNNRNEYELLDTQEGRPILATSLLEEVLEKFLATPEENDPFRNLRLRFLAFSYSNWAEKISAIIFAEQVIVETDEQRLQREQEEMFVYLKSLGNINKYRK